MRRHFLLLGFCLFNYFTTIAQSHEYTEWYLSSPDSLDPYDQDIYVKELGKGKDTVIVIHGGFGANHDYMLDAIAGLEDDFHFVLYDQRGSLLSPARKEDLTFEKNVHDLELLVEQLGLKKVKIMAHSMGTIVAMEYLKLNPERVNNIVLIGAIYTKSDSMEYVFSKRMDDQIMFLSSRKEITEQPIYKKYVEVNGNFSSNKDRTDCNRLFFASSNIYDISRYRLMRGGFHYFKEEASAMFETVNWKYDYRSLLNDKAKTTILFGDHDFIDFNADYHKSHIESYPNIRLELFEKAGHNIWIDQPEVFRQKLFEALRR